jgi:hypothetical protein
MTLHQLVNSPLASLTLAAAFGCDSWGTKDCIGMSYAHALD